MAMNKDDLANKIKEVMADIRKEESDPDASMNLFAEKIAEAIVDEVRKMTITATAPNGPVTVTQIA